MGRVDAVGLEVIAKLSEDEFLDLETISFCGKMKFREVMEDYSKEIYLEIVYSKEQKELLEVYSIPENVYFRKADKIKFSINGQFYKEIDNYGSFGTRFWIGGKFEIRVQKT